MADGSTTHFGWVTPQINGSINTWGTKLNANLNELDSTLWSISGGITSGFNDPTSSATNITLSNPMVSFNSLAYTTANQSTIMPVMNANTSPQVGTQLTLYNSGSYGFRVLAQDAATVVFGSGIATGNITSGGVTYTNGYYADVPLTGGTGTGAAANITVAGNIVTNVWLTNRGKNFVVNDTLSASAANIGGTGSGFTFQVASLTNLVPGSTLLLTPTSNASANGGFNAVVQGDLFSQNNLADIGDTNLALNTLLPQQSGNSGFLLTTNGMNASWTAINFVPTGQISMFPVRTAPINYHELNGALLSRTSYAALWAFAQASGNIVADSSWDYGMFSTGDGSTTFRIPDYRGYFPRGWDDGRGVDVGRTIGSSQADGVGPLTINDPGHYHSYLGIGGYGGLLPTGGGTNVPATQTGTSNTGITIIGNISETRPKNIAVMFCIKT